MHSIDHTMKVNNARDIPSLGGTYNSIRHALTIMLSSYNGQYTTLSR